jgi:Fe-S cluster assembly protein SufD
MSSNITIDEIPSSLTESADFAIMPNEPSWLCDRRRQAAADFEQLPLPGAKDDRWRFASIARLSNDWFEAPLIPVKSTNSESLLERSHLVDAYSGRAVFINDNLIALNPVSDEWINKGVRYLPVEQALTEMSELMQERFLIERTTLGSEKFHAWHAQMIKAGMVLYVPRNCIIENPFVNYYWLDGEGARCFPHTLVVAEDNSELSIVDVFFSADTSSSGFSCSASTIYAGTGAKIFRKVVQDWNEQTISFQLDKTLAGRDAEVKNVAVNIGASLARYENQVQIDGAGAHVKLYSLTVAEEHQEFDQRTLQVHNAPNAVSDLLYKNALMDNSRTIFSGLIKVAEGAQQTDAYQTNRNLLLDPTADANALPGLEILANDVKCSHGATTGNFDPQELFYLMSRGISKRAAMQLMVFGFFEEIIEKVDSEELAENLRMLIHNKFDTKVHQVKNL